LVFKVQGRWRKSAGLTTFPLPSGDPAKLWSFGTTPLQDPLSRFGPELDLSAEVSLNGVQFWRHRRPIPTHEALELLALASHRASAPGALEAEAARLTTLALQHGGQELLCESPLEAANALAVLNLDGNILDAVASTSTMVTYLDGNKTLAALGTAVRQAGLRRLPPDLIDFTLRVIPDLTPAAKRDRWVAHGARLPQYLVNTALEALAWQLSFDSLQSHDRSQELKLRVEPVGKLVQVSLERAQRSIAEPRVTDWLNYFLSTVTGKPQVQRSVELDLAMQRDWTGWVRMDFGSALEGFGVDATMLAKELSRERGGNVLLPPSPEKPSLELYGSRETNPQWVRIERDQIAVHCGPPFANLRLTLMLSNAEQRFDLGAILALRESGEELAELLEAQLPSVPPAGR
jgi:hypothetical protein